MSSAEPLDVFALTTTFDNDGLGRRGLPSRPPRWTASSPTTSAGFRCCRADRPGRPARARRMSGRRVARRVLGGAIEQEGATRRTNSPFNPPSIPIQMVARALVLSTRGVRRRSVQASSRTWHVSRNPPHLCRRSLAPQSGPKRPGRPQEPPSAENKLLGRGTGRPS